MSISIYRSEDRTAASTGRRLDDADLALIEATQDGLPLVADPWTAVGERIGMCGEEVLARFQRLLLTGVLRRMAAVPNHYRLGYLANGMTVWDIDDARIGDIGRRLAQWPGVSHCYRRPRRGPDWPYNLFVMLHGHQREEVERQAEQLRELMGDACRDHQILFSTRILKKTGLRLTRRQREASCSE
ncbi:Lrp/AsnC family transcriptional regulator [Halomonas sp. DP8Y7-3]|uniref:siroheme decarboxylase subunit beta n=1 Tax=Halomonas sp. DP8Y7-3 TaxID=2859079 RepID=UPI001C986FA9|nr:Lrp/AsnC family transcriptional regulator [Halomonas sp. DP8Y7-3]MBY5928602.1 Lrp/AsnC family transcriptional regulator [Halomonas sp. DP8Y7-3]